MRDDIISALSFFYERLGTSGWYVIGSTSLALQGLNFEPDDIDIKVSSENLEKLTDCLGTKVSEHYKTEINGVEVELIDKDNPEDFWDPWSPPSEDFKPNLVEVAGMRIPVYPLRECLRVYKMLDRPKDVNKIEKLEKFLDSAKL
jgi:hypothetical protein